jgi:tetratricopeptide (TPR) repeat protein
MQKRDVTFIAHVSLTNHRIVARPDEPLPDIMFQQTTTALPDLIHLDAAPGKENVPPPLLTLFQAYGELTTYKPEYVDAYLKVLDQLSQMEPDDGLVQAALGSRDLKEGRFSEAVDHFQHSLEIGPRQATVYGDLSAALEKLGRSDEALSAQKKAIEQDPYNPVVQKRLALLFIQRKQYGDAQATIEHYLETFPQDSFMRHMLALSKGEEQRK